MISKSFYYLPLCLLSVVQTWAQAPDTEADQPHIDIESVEVKGERIKRVDHPSIGARVSTMSADALQLNRAKSLSELLSGSSVVYMKSMGRGAYTTASFRGTGSRHTQVSWNGIAINPVMGSSFDFSTVPVVFTDNVNLTHGGSQQKNGTGALGGNVNLINTPDWQDSTLLHAFAEVGAYDTYTGSAIIRTVREKSLYQTRLFYQQSENNYRYLNKIFAKDPFYERRKDANYRMMGAMQEAYFRPNPYSTISNIAWFMYTRRRLPQSLTVNPTSHERNLDYGLKYLFSYDYRRVKEHAFSVKAAYVLDILDYYHWSNSSYYQWDESTFNRAQTFYVSGDYTYTPSERFQLNSSFRYSYDLVHTPSYTSDEGETSGESSSTAETKHQVSIGRNILTAQTNALWRINRWLEISGMVMGELNEQQFAPTFSAGLSAVLTPRLTAKASISYNYAFPSMNDLYWQPGGNPDLKPEKGFTYDATLRYATRIGERLYANVEATGYLMNIDNWIMWLPEKDTWFFQPRNIQNVLSYGVELTSGWALRLNDFTAKLDLCYTFSPSINRERNFEEDNTYRKQLPYVPRHKANGLLSLNYKNIRLKYQAYYCSKRYISQDESYSTNSYTVHNAALEYDFRICKRYKLTPGLQIDNLFDTYYESTIYYPMPLRSVCVNVAFSF